MNDCVYDCDMHDFANNTAYSESQIQLSELSDRYVDEDADSSCSVISWVHFFHADSLVERMTDG